MTGGFRSIIAGIIGRFWSSPTPSIPPNDGIPVTGTQRAPVLFVSKSRPLVYRKTELPILFDESRSLPLFYRHSIPLTFKAND